MKNFLNENWFKVGLLFLASTSILFYVFSWQPLQKKKEQLANNIKCQQEGTQLLERMKKELSSKRSYYGKAEFRFVPELSTCLLKVSLTFESENGSIQYAHFIRDVYAKQRFG